MSESDDFDLEEQREKLADTFNYDPDPNAKLAEAVEGTGVEPIEMFFAERVESNGLGKRTIRRKRTALNHWKEHMKRKGRHPAFPNEGHVRSFIEHERNEKDNEARTIRQKIGFIEEAYEYWQMEGIFPHEQDYNPIASVRANTDLSDTPQKRMPRIPVETLREILGGVNHRLHRAIMVTQLKLGMRSGEVANMQLQDVNISHENLQEDYPELGTHPEVENRPNSIYVPPSVTEGGREGNKSKEPRVLPLDDEMRRVLVDYLLIRPLGSEARETEAPWVFLSDTDNVQLVSGHASRIWREELPEGYEETKKQRKVRSHFGRHFFSTYWNITQDMNEQYVQYMRGDSTKVSPGNTGKSINSYLHTYYEDIEETYRENVYRLLD